MVVPQKGHKIPFNPYASKQFLADYDFWDERAKYIIDPRRIQVDEVVPRFLGGPQEWYNQFPVDNGSFFESALVSSRQKCCSWLPNGTILTSWTHRWVKQLGDNRSESGDLALSRTSSDGSFILDVANDHNTGFQFLFPITIALRDLPGEELAISRIDSLGERLTPARGTIVIDPSAAGAGWSMAWQPQINDAKYDLQTVVTHELLHLLAFNVDIPGFLANVRLADGHNSFVGSDFVVPLSKPRNLDHVNSELLPDDLMNAVLRPGVRRFPSELNLKVVNTVMNWSAAFDSLGIEETSGISLTAEMLTGWLNPSFLPCAVI